MGELVKYAARQELNYKICMSLSRPNSPEDVNKALESHKSSKDLPVLCREIIEMAAHEVPHCRGTFHMLGKACFVIAMVFLARCVAVLSWFGWVYGISWAQRRTSFPSHM